MPFRFQHPIEIPEDVARVDDLAPIVAIVPNVDARVTESRHYKFSGTGPFILGSPTPKTHASDNAQFGAWAEIIAATATSVYMYAITLMLRSLTSAPMFTTVQIGTGPASSETIVAEFGSWLPSGSTNGTDNVSLPLPFPLAIATATRIAVRVKAGEFNKDVSVVAMGIRQVDLVALP